jgi:hypothetical protein
VQAQDCTPTTNIEAIVDDSRSMSDTDPRRLRVRALQLLMDTPGNESRTLGAIEFYEDWRPLFGPEQIGDRANRERLGAILESRITGDDPSTDYNAAFDGAGAHNPSAGGRIFLTDGEHFEETEGPYQERHRGGPPTYVIGLASAEYLRPDSPDEQRLQRIAAETGGRYWRASTDEELQDALFELNAAISCEPTPVKQEVFFSRTGQVVQRALSIPRGTRSVKFAVSWGSEFDSFNIGTFRIRRRGRVVARSSRVRRIRVVKRRGETYVTGKLTGLVPGRLTYRIKANSVGFTGRPAAVTLQAIRSRAR